MPLKVVASAYPGLIQISYRMSPAQHSPVRLFVTLLLLIFCIAGALMFVLRYAFPKVVASVWAEALIDATLLTIFSSMFIWRLLMRPLAFALRSEAARARAVMDTAAEGMFGYETREALGKNVRILMPELHASAHDGYIARYVRRNDAAKVAESIISVLSASFSLVKHTQVVCIGVSYWHRDLSHRRPGQERPHQGGGYRDVQRQAVEEHLPFFRSDRRCARRTAGSVTTPLEVLSSRPAIARKTAAVMKGLGLG